MTAGDSAAPARPAAEQNTGALMRAERELRRRAIERLARASVRTPAVIADAIERECAALRDEYPELDLARELRDERFRRLLKGGAGVRGAYESLHPGLMREAAERAVLARVRERSLRPEENGAAAGAPFSASAAAALTPAGRAELARRAYAGERIIF